MRRAKQDILRIETSDGRRRNDLRRSFNRTLLRAGGGQTCATIPETCSKSNQKACRGATACTTTDGKKYRIPRKYGRKQWDSCDPKSMGFTQRASCVYRKSARRSGSPRKASPRKTSGRKASGRKSSSRGRRVPSDQKLYDKVKSEVKKRVRVWPSAYASGQVVTEYLRRGGTYEGGEKKPRRARDGIGRWFDEKWIDVCQLPRVVACGRKKSNWKDYPYCRPSIRVNSGTPKTAGELTKKEIRDRCARKKRHPKKRIT